MYCKLQFCKPEWIYMTDISDKISGSQNYRASQYRVKW